jgi:hypothetical protein
VVTDFSYAMWLVKESSHSRWLAQIRRRKAARFKNTAPPQKIQWRSFNFFVTA